MFQLSWNMFVYKVQKSKAEIEETPFVLFSLLIVIVIVIVLFSFSRLQNAVRTSKLFALLGIPERTTESCSINDIY